MACASAAAQGSAGPRVKRGRDLDASTRYAAAAGRAGGPHQGPPLGALPGATRSCYKRDHALLAPESRVYQPLPGWGSTVGACLVSPSMPGALLSMTLVEMSPGGFSAPMLPGVERCVVVLQGEVTCFGLQGPGLPYDQLDLQPDGFAFWPAVPVASESRAMFGNNSGDVAVALVFDQKYRSPPEHLAKQPGPKATWGTVEDAVQFDPGPDESFTLRKLLPTDMTYDMNIHVMDFEPGTSLGVKELHYNQHALFMLEGAGIYRLGQNDWYPVTAGDAMYIGPWALQWYGACGPGAAPPPRPLLVGARG